MAWKKTMKCLLGSHLVGRSLGRGGWLVATEVCSLKLKCLMPKRPFQKVKSQMHELGNPDFFLN